MNWTEILAKAGIEDSPGRAEAVQFAMSKAAEREMIRKLPKERKRSRRSHYPSLKHSTQD